ncbi:MAG: LytTR family transcriptional regulator DNA-binding domain-containing protein [Bacteroidia bacterium]
MRSYAAIQDKAQYQWLATPEGLKIYKENQLNTLDSIKKQYPLLAKSIIDIEIDKQQMIWIGTDGCGLYAISPIQQAQILNNQPTKTNPYLSVPALENKIIKALFIDAQNRVWVSTNQGAYSVQINPQTQTFLVYRYSIAQGLPTNEVHSIYADDSTVFIGTNEGLVKIRLKEKQSKAQLSELLHFIMLRVVIIEDELQGRNLLYNALKNYCPQVQVLAMAKNVPEGIEAIEKYQPNLIFLDIELEGQTGFDLLQQFPLPTFKVIFYTAYGHYAIDAFKFSAIDYLVKPLSIAERLIPAIAKAEEELTKEGYLMQMQKQVDTLTEHIRKPGNVNNKLIIPTQTGFEVLRVQEIIRCEASKNYTLFFSSQKKQYVSAYGIGSYESNLKAYNFFRTHNSHIVNFDHIIRFNKMGETGELTMSDNSIVPVSKRNREDFLLWLKK